MNSTDDGMAAVWTSIRVLLVTIGGILAGEGLANTGAYKWIMIAAGAIGVVGPAIWGVWVAITAAARKRADVAKAVQAGVNLVVSGQALSVDGKTITAIGEHPDTVPPMPVTEKTAAEIVKNFAPSDAPKAS